MSDEMLTISDRIQHKLDDLLDFFDVQRNNLCVERV